MKGPFTKKHKLITLGIILLIAFIATMVGCSELMKQDTPAPGVTTPSESPATPSEPGSKPIGGIIKPGTTVKTPDTSRPSDEHKPDATRPETTEPGKQVSEKPEATKPDTTKPDATKPDTSKPGVTQLTPTPQPTQPKPAPVEPKPTPTPTPTPQPPAHEHSWSPVYKTIHHPAETKTVQHDAVTEQVWVVDKEATQVEYLKRFYVCNDTGKTWVYDTGIHTPADHDAMKAEMKDFFINQALEGGAGSYTTWDEYYTVGEPEQGHYETKVVKAAWTETVVVKAAWSEQVIDYYKCSCGETKRP